MMPFRAARFMPAMKATGAAMMSGQGVATTRTAANRPGSAEMIHARAAMSSDTAVKGTAFRSAIATKGAREAWAERTMAMIRWYWESAEPASARITIAAEPLTEPAIT